MSENLGQFFGHGHTTRANHSASGGATAPAAADRYLYRLRSPGDDYVLVGVAAFPIEVPSDIGQLGDGGEGWRHK